jgi:penicillin-binding protein 1A
VANRGEITRGGSTITMQLPRNLGTFSLDQVFIRKFKEILLALKIERELTKDEILELYINAVPFGKRAYGAQAAAYTYYGRPLSEAVAAAAGHAGRHSPGAHRRQSGQRPGRAMNRRNVVLSRMLEQRSITREQYDQALAAPEHRAPLRARAGRCRAVSRRSGCASSSSAGCRICTAAATKSSPRCAATCSGRPGTPCAKGLRSYDRRHGYRGPGSQPCRCRP